MKYQFRLDDTAFQNLLLKIETYDIKLDNIEDFESTFKIHIDMIYDRLEILNIDVIPVLAKLKVLYPELCKISLSLHSDIENIYNATLSDVEVLSIFLFLQHFKNE